MRDPDGVHKLELALPAAPAAVTVARAAVTGHFAAVLAHTVLHDARLLVSELVANGVRHAGLTPDERLRLRARLTAGRLRVEVCNPGVRGTAAPRNWGAGDGLGLFLVASLAHRWGIERRAHTCVWFELAATPAAVRTAVRERSQTAPTAGLLVSGGVRGRSRRTSGPLTKRECQLP